MHVDPTVGWFKILFAIFLIGIFVRLVSAKRIGLLALFAFAGVFVTYGLRQGHLAPPRPAQIDDPTIMRTSAYEVAEVPLQIVGVQQAPSPPPAEKPTRPKRGPKSKSAEKTVPAAPPLPAKEKVAEAPPKPPVAAVADKSDAATPSEPVDSEAPLTLYHGWSISGRPIDSLPAWVKELEKAQPGADRISFSSDRFATIEEAEKQLWDRARDFVARDLRLRIPEAVRWSPSPDLLKSHGFILERCIERTSIDLGKFVEPMYRVHWKATLSQNVRESVVDAWRPRVQNERLEMTALSFLGATAFLAFVNVLLRLAPCPKAKTTPPAAA
jgi:hypothetical protein